MAKGLLDLREALSDTAVMARDIEQTGQDEPTVDGASHIGDLVSEALEILEEKYLPHVYVPTLPRLGLTQGGVKG